MLIGYKGTTKIAYMQIFVRILTLFCANSGKIAMSGIDTDVRRQGKEAFKGVNQLPYVTDRQVGAAIAHLKQCISVKEGLFVRKI